MKQIKVEKVAIKSSNFYFYELLSPSVKHVDVKNMRIEGLREFIRSLEPLKDIEKLEIGSVKAPEIIQEDLFY